MVFHVMKLVSQMFTILKKGGVRYNFYPRSTGGRMRNIKTNLPSTEILIDWDMIGTKIRFYIIR